MYPKLTPSYSVSTKEDVLCSLLEHELFELMLFVSVERNANDDNVLEMFQADEVAISVLGVQSFR